MVPWPACSNAAKHRVRTRLAVESGTPNRTPSISLVGVLFGVPDDGQ
ncbi:hypothetical protein [Gemmata massiliana]|nr:hypothetical protein [Gemmata massiliana]